MTDHDAELRRLRAAAWLLALASALCFFAAAFCFFVAALIRAGGIPQ